MNLWRTTNQCRQCDQSSVPGVGYSVKPSEWGDAAWDRIATGETISQ